MNCINCGIELPDNQMSCPHCKTTQNSTSVNPLLKRALLFIEEGDIGRADDYCEQVLDSDPENPHAYIIKLMIRAQVKREEDLAHASTSYATWKSYQNAIRFADDSLRQKLQSYLESTENSLRIKAEEEAMEEAKRQREAEQLRRERIYREACRYDHPNASSKELEKALSLYRQIPNHLDSSAKITTCTQKISELREESIRWQLAEMQRQNRIRKIRIVVCLILIVCIIIATTIIVHAIKVSRRREAEQLEEQLIGKSFGCSYCVSGDYYYEPHEDIFNVPKTYYECYVNYSFQSQNSIKLFRKTYTVKNPYKVIDGEIQWDSISSDSDIINGYSVSVSFFGRATVIIDGIEFNLNIGRNGELISMSDQSHTYTLQ